MITQSILIIVRQDTDTRIRKSAVHTAGIINAQISITITTHQWQKVSICGLLEMIQKRLP